MNHENPKFIRVRQALEMAPVGETRVLTAIAAGEFRSTLLTRPGKKRGVRLIDRESFLAWLDGKSPAEPRHAAPEIDTPLQTER